MDGSMWFISMKKFLAAQHNRARTTTMPRGPTWQKASLRHQRKIRKWRFEWPNSVAQDETHDGFYLILQYKYNLYLIQSVRLYYRTKEDSPCTSHVVLLTLLGVGQGLHVIHCNTMQHMVKPDKKMLLNFGPFQNQWWLVNFFLR